MDQDCHFLKSALAAVGFRTVRPQIQALQHQVKNQVPQEDLISLLHKTINKYNNIIIIACELTDMVKSLIAVII